jgi:hypothetical protein
LEGMSRTFTLQLMQLIMQPEVLASSTILN